MPENIYLTICVKVLDNKVKLKITPTIKNPITESEILTNEACQYLTDYLR